MGMTQTEIAGDSDVAAIAEMLHADLMSQYSEGQQVPISDVKEKASDMISMLESNIPAVKVLIAMEKRGYIERWKKEYKLNGAH